MARGSFLQTELTVDVQIPGPSKRISILKTEGEWHYISQMLADDKNCDLHSYLHREISRLSTKYVECEVCITKADGVLKSYRHNIPTHIYMKLLPLAQKMGKPVATIINDLLITPLLLPDRDAAV